MWRIGAAGRGCLVGEHIVASCSFFSVLFSQVVLCMFYVRGRLAAWHRTGRRHRKQNVMDLLGHFIMSSK